VANFFCESSETVWGERTLRKRIAASGPGEDLGAGQSNFRQLAAKRRKKRGRHTWESGASHVSIYGERFSSRH
jgi:hypothetical protein